MYRLYLRRRPDGVVELHLGWGWRAFFALFAGTVFVAGLTGFGLGPGAWVVIGVSALASMYREDWRFDHRRGAVLARTGVLFFYRTKRYDLGRIESVVVRTRAQLQRPRPLDKTPVIPAMIQRGYVQLLLQLGPPDGGYALIHTEPLRAGNTVESLGRALAGALALPLDHR